MKGSKEIMESMIEGQEYVNGLMTKETYLRINDEIREEIAITIRVKSDLYGNDEIYNGLSKNAYKANKAVRDYEFELNNNK